MQQLGPSERPGLGEGAVRSSPGRRRVRRAKACAGENLRSSCQGSRTPGKRSVVCRELDVVEGLSCSHPVPDSVSCYLPEKK